MMDVCVYMNDKSQYRGGKFFGKKKKITHTYTKEIGFGFGQEGMDSMRLKLGNGNVYSTDIYRLIQGRRPQRPRPNFTQMRFNTRHGLMS